MNMERDASHLRQVILDSIEQIHHQFTVENLPVDKVDRYKNEYAGYFDEIIINGMGGSAIPAELLLSGFFQLSDNKKLPPIFIHRSYGSSKRMRERSLTMAISYSGNTEETLSAYESSLQTTESVIAIASGGKLIERAQELGQPYVVLPKPSDMFQPRYATLYILKAMLDVLVTYGLLDSGVAYRLESSLNGLDPADFEEKGKVLAQHVVGKTPVVYATNEFKRAALLWKIKMNENAKTPCFWNYVPELNHNEMVGFTHPQAEFQFFFLSNESERDTAGGRRLENMHELFTERGLSVEEVVVADYGNHLANLLAMILVGDWTAYYTALAYDIDPTPVDMVEDFKHKMEDSTR